MGQWIPLINSPSLKHVFYNSISLNPAQNLPLSSDGILEITAVKDLFVIMLSIRRHIHIINKTVQRSVITKAEHSCFGSVSFCDLYPCIA